MKLYQSISLTIALCISSLYAESQVYPSIQEITSVIKREVDNGRSSSIAIGIIDNGNVNYICYGNPIEGNLQKANEKTIYEIASVTKVFVTTILADLVLKGVLSLDDPITKYLPDSLLFQDTKINKITLKHLATHTSNLDSLFIYDLQRPHYNYNYEYLFASLEKYQFQNDPGMTYKYSNINMAFLAYIICKVADKDLESLFKDKIFDPFQMENTALKLSKDQEKYFATAYHRPGSPAKIREWNADAGAGALRSNVQDLTIFLRKLFYDDSPLKKAASFAIIPQFDSTNFPNTKIGLGWFITPSNNSLFVGHGGNTYGFRSMILYDIKMNRGVVVLSNSTADISDIGFYIFDKKKRIREYKQVQSKTLSDELALQLEGTFSITFGKVSDTITIYRNNKFLIMNSKIIGEIEMFYQGKNCFFIPYVGEKVVFKDFNENKAQTILSEEKGITIGKRIASIRKY